MGRKEPYCGAVGSGRFEVSTRADPTSLQAGEPILLTIRIQAIGAWTRAPERPDLANKPEYAKFRQQFHIDNDEERASPDRGQWEFHFRLRPKSERVKEVPSLTIVYFRPGFTPPEKGYMTTAAPAIPLQVASRAKVLPSEIRGQSAARESPGYLYEIVTGPAVLRQHDSFVFPAAWLIILLSAAPPAVSIGWYLVWKQRNPTQARLGRLRKSRAGRQALLALQPVARSGDRATTRVDGTSVKHNSQEEACGVAKVLAGYLQERLDFSATQPTPADITAHLLAKGIPADLANRTAELFRACDMVRFGPLRPQGMQTPPLRAEAVDLVMALESQP